MELTILSHFYNEEYLLPYWLNHHKKIFHKGIMIDYDSTDRSVEIIRDICPHWTVVKSANRDFQSVAVDHEVMRYEKEICPSGNNWNPNNFHICLNTTEFLFGDFNLLKDPHYFWEKQDCGWPGNPKDGPRVARLYVRAYYMVDHPDKEFTEIEGDLFTDRSWGFVDIDGIERCARVLHNCHTGYSPGRHFRQCNTSDFIILYYGFSPYNDKMLKRKLQIQDRIPESDKRLGAGFQHITDEEKLYERLKNYQKNSSDLSEQINKWKTITYSYEG